MRYMKLLLLGLCCPFLGTAQLPNPVYRSMNYQGVARDANGDPLTNQTVGLKFIVGYGIGAIYSESQTLTTNDQGLVVAKIGEGIKDGNYPDFQDLGWSTTNPSNLPFWLQVGMDPTGGTNYVFPPVNPELISAVPFAQRARFADRADIVGDSSWVTNGNVVYNTDHQVGIGTDTPSEQLEVSGHAKVGSLFVGDGVFHDGTGARDMVMRLNPLQDIYFSLQSNGANEWEFRG
ncbi:MAG: hypothetical protein KDC03_20735, partial [Flavobacteriales bacterium]|nr:hypothetical protein [Flavobacteriales bacterium]